MGGVLMGEKQGWALTWLPQTCRSSLALLPPSTSGPRPAHLLELAPWRGCWEGPCCQGFRVSVGGAAGTPKGVPRWQDACMFREATSQLASGCTEARVTLLLTFLRGHVAPTGRDSCGQGLNQPCSQGGACSPSRPHSRSHPMLLLFPGFRGQPAL